MISSLHLRHRHRRRSTPPDSSSRRPQGGRACAGVRTARDAVRAPARPGTLLANPGAERDVGLHDPLWLVKADVVFGEGVGVVARQEDRRGPSGTARVTRAAFPKGSLAMRIRDELGGLFSDADFAGLYPSRGSRRGRRAGWHWCRSCSSPRDSRTGRPQTQCVGGWTGSTCWDWSWSIRVRPFGTHRVQGPADRGRRRDRASGPGP